MVDFKKTTAPNNTITRDVHKLAERVGNIYEVLTILGKRSNQISVEMKEELSRKLLEFASYTDNLEEIFENREQIEISRFYERLPKPTLIAIEEYLNDEIYYRNPAREGQKAY
jgi:DNA-directed RNA polymerase subunit K/omega